MDKFVRLGEKEREREVSFNYPIGTLCSMGWLDTPVKIYSAIVIYSRCPIKYTLRQQYRNAKTCK